ncbi:MAG: 23S rRNA (uracil(1939)-C(5))-methyltransferase RlmD [Candidatus Aminicenantes bacterium]|nr:23S rRNA (uracil(1939)-C(5))-methyltransferase RlmD [Candidatus Aminicenantes bacterium]
MELRVEKIVYPGRALARAEGKIVFTDEGLPGELVEVEILKDKKNYAEARTLKILEPSADRQLPRCGHYQACSPYQVMTYDLELRTKKAQLLEIFSGLYVGHQQPLELVPSPQIYGYRNKIRLSFSWQAQPPFLAYHKPGSRASFLPVESCALVSEKVNAIISRFKTLLRGEPLPAIRHLEIRESFWSGELLLLLEAAEEDSLERAAHLWLPALTMDSPVAGVVGLVQEGRRKIFSRLIGRDYLEEKVGQVVFRYGAGSFFQVNPPQLEKVAEKIKQHLQPQAPVKLIDLYAGLGTFGLLLSASASEVMAIESDPSNIFFLKKNLRLNRIQHLVVAEGRSEDWIDDILEFRAGALVIDPPRKGLAEELVEALVSHPPGLVFYLSCNPTTLARDLKKFLQAYELLEIIGLDFFPRTPHIETLAVLRARTPVH